MVALFFLSLLKSKFTIMKIKILTEIERDNRIYEKGDIIDIPEVNVPVWEKNKWGKAIKTKEEKRRKETKEFKGKKETK